jgi:hypothetical protein
MRFAVKSAYSCNSFLEAFEAHFANQILLLLQMLTFGDVVILMRGKLQRKYCVGLWAAVGEGWMRNSHSADDEAGSALPTERILSQLTPKRSRWLKFLDRLLPLKMK